VPACLAVNVLSVLSHYPAPTEIYTLSLHDALPISRPRRSSWPSAPPTCRRCVTRSRRTARPPSHGWPSWRGRSRSCAIFPSSSRSEEHTSELQSQSNLVCRLLLEKKNKKKKNKKRK